MEFGGVGVEGGGEADEEEWEFVGGIEGEDEGGEDGSASDGAQELEE